MNKIKGIITSFIILTGMAFLTGCVKGTLETPPVNFPTVNFSANTSITKLQTMHLAGGTEVIDSNIIIKGKVVSSDKSGMIYKAIYIEDDSAGIEIPLDQSNLYTTYKLGQRVYIKCKGLTMGEAKGNLELGYSTGGVVGRIPAYLIPQFVFPDSLPGAIPAPVSLTASNFANAKYLNMLVKFDSIYFLDSNQVFCPTTSSYVNHQIGAIPTTSLVLYVTPYASYAAAIVPAGTGTVTGIMVKYNTVYELMIRDLNDLSGFNH